MKKNILTRIMMVVLSISILLSSFSAISVIADSSNTEEGTTTPLNITVNNNGVDETEIYKSTNQINVVENTRGNFGNIYYFGGAENCTYYYSADICVKSDTSTYGSIRMVLGYCQYENNKKYIEVCVRPSLSGQTVFFLNGNGEYAVKVGQSQTNIKIGDTYHCLAKYDCGKVSFWINDILIFDAISLPNTVTDVNLEAGFYSQNCKGTISNINIWGDMETCECPQIEKNENLIYDVAIKDSETGVYKQAKDGYLTYSGLNTYRTDFYGIEYGNEYSLNTTARFYDNKTLNGENEVNWEGLIFNLATAKLGDKTYNIELRVRKNIAVFFAVDRQGSFSETVIFIKGGKTVEYNKNYDYNVKYHKNGTLSLWINKDPYLSYFDISEYGYTDIKPLLSLGGEVCSYSFEDIKLWGDISVDATEYSNETQLYNSDYSFNYDLKFPTKPQNNKNYIEDAKLYSSANSDESVCTNVYLDFLALRKLKRVNDKDFGTLDFALLNAGTATDFDNNEEVTYSFDFTSKDTSNSGITLYARYFYEKKNTLSFVLTPQKITVNNSDKTEEFTYPAGIKLFGAHNLTIKMDGRSAVLFIDGAVCTKTCYNSLSVPMFTVVSKSADLDLENAEVYRNAADTDTVYTESRYEKGDINTDDDFNVKDLVRYKRILSGKNSVSDKSASDINSDGKYNSVDISLIKKALLSGRLGFGGNISVFHDQSEVYMSDIEPDFNEDLELTLRAEYGTVTNATIQISNDFISWKSYDMYYDSTDKTGSYQYFKGTVPGQSSAFYYRFKAYNNVLGTEKTLTGINTKNSSGWYCMVGQQTPDWAKGTLWYSLVPDAFFNGDLTNDRLNSGNNTINSWNNVHMGLTDFYGGDLKGVEQKLDYIKSLGAESIYMNPISKSYQNAGYGTTDYNQIEPGFGNADSLNSLVSAIHNNDMRIMTDVVLYFSPLGSIYVNKYGCNPLQGALQSKTSPYTQMLIFDNWPEYTATEWGGMYTDLFNNALQSLLYKSSGSALQRLVGEYKIDGLRFDCGGYLGSKTDTTLRNTLIKDIRKNLKGVNSDMLMLSEYDYHNMTGYSWDSQWNLDLRSAFQVFITGELMSGQTYNTTVSSLKNVMTRSLYKLPRQQSLTIQNLISYHDADRIYIDSAAGRSSALVQMTYLGAPVIYYGQEIGLYRETENGVSQSGHAATSFHSMNWNEEDWDYDMLSFYQTLGGIRKDYTALKTGAVEDIVCDDSKGLLGFARYDKNGAVITLANRGNEIDQYEISVSKFGLKDGSVVTDCFSGKKYIVINGKINVQVPSGGTLFVSGITENAEPNEKTALVSGTGYVTADMEGEGAYCISLTESLAENSSSYGAVVNGEKVYVNVKREENGTTAKQTEFTLPQGAELRLNRALDNIFYCSYILDGNETVISHSAVEIAMERQIKAQISNVSGYAVPKKITFIKTNETALYDGFDSIIPNTDWKGMIGEKIKVANGKLLLSDGGFVSRNVPCDDWTAETYIVSGNGAVSVLKDNENYLELRYNDSLQFVLVTNGTEEVLAEKEISDYKGVYLQISRVGTDYAAFYSLNGKNWNTLGCPIYYNPSTVTIGLSAKGSDAEFEYFMFGDGVDESNIHIFGGENFAYTEKRLEPAYKIESGAFEYVEEGIKSTTTNTALMSINNISYTDFYSQVTLSAEGSSTKAGLAFGMNSSSSFDGYTLYKNASTLILKYGTKTLKRALLSDDRITVWLRNGILSVYIGSEAKCLYSIELTDYNGGYVGFFSENGEAKFANYYVANISDNWVAVSGDVSGDENSVSAVGYDNIYGTVAYRGYAFGNGTLNATISIDSIIDSKSSYSGGLMLGSSFGKSPDKNGVCIAIEDRKAVLKYKGKVIDSYTLSTDKIKISVTVESGNYTVNINDGGKLMSCSAPDCIAGALILYSVNARATLSNCSVQ